MDRKRAGIAVIILVAVASIVLGIDYWQRQQSVDLPPGSIPIRVDERLVGGFLPTDLDELQKVSFVDAEEGKTQEGWLLRNVLLRYLSQESLTTDTIITVQSNSREKSAQFTWAEVDRIDNMVMFDLSGRGTLKLVSKLERLDTRDEWVQDVDEIQVTRP